MITSADPSVDDQELVFFVRLIFRYDINLFDIAYAFNHDLSLLFYILVFVHHFCCVPCP